MLQTCNVYLEVNAKRFYLLLYSIALRSLSLSPLNILYMKSLHNLVKCIAIKPSRVPCSHLLQSNISTKKCYLSYIINYLKYQDLEKNASFKFQSYFTLPYHAADVYYHGNLDLILKGNCSWILIHNLG